MTAASTARAKANRANARRSTGPRTPAGKAKVAQNAWRHGLSKPVALDPGLSADIQSLTRLVAGPSPSAKKLAAAREVAEAQIEVCRVRQARLALLNNPGGRIRKLRGGKRAAQRDACGFAAQDAFEEPEGVIEEDMFDGASMHAITSQLLALDRYERRALSKRKFAMREFEDLEAEEQAAAAP